MTRERNKQVLKICIEAVLSSALKVSKSILNWILNLLAANEISTKGVHFKYVEVTWWRCGPNSESLGHNPILEM